MHRHTRKWIPALALAALFAASSRAAAQDVDAIIEWQRLLQVTVAGTATPTVFFTRPLSLGLLLTAAALVVIVALPQISHKREEAFQEGD